jgi:hypothetical protein
MAYAVARNSRTPQSKALFPAIYRRAAPVRRAAFTNARCVLVSERLASEAVYCDMETPMKTAAIAFAAVVLLSSPVVADVARAEPLTLSRTIVKDGFGKLRRYCDQASRCWTEGYRNPLLETYATIGAPPWFRQPVVAAKADRSKTASLRAPVTTTKKAGRSPLDAQARMR